MYFFSLVSRISKQENKNISIYVLALKFVHCWLILARSFYKSRLQKQLDYVFFKLLFIYFINCIISTVNIALFFLSEIVSSTFLSVLSYILLNYWHMMWDRSFVILAMIRFKAMSKQVRFSFDQPYVTIISVYNLIHQKEEEETCCCLVDQFRYFYINI